MPAFAMPGAEVQSIVLFLRSLVPAPLHGSKLGEEERSIPDVVSVPFERLMQPDRESHNWLTYWGNLQGWHFSNLKEIVPKNISSLHPAWVFQFGGGNVETTPLVADGYMFVTGPQNNAAALDARTGEVIWRYSRNLPDIRKECTVMTNRGLAILDDRLYMATLDAHLVALNARTGKVIWDIPVEDYHKGFTITLAPLAANGRIFVGVTSGECGLNGFVAAYNSKTGQRLWRTSAIAPPGDPNRSTWSGKSAETGGGPTWMTGTYDAPSGTVFWTTGNPSPDYDGSVRLGDNLYTNSVLALDEKTGAHKWHFQFTPHDTHDWDANETPILIDAPSDHKTGKLLVQANRNGFFYALDRGTGKFLHGKAFVKQTWAERLDENSRPVLTSQAESSPKGVYVCPDASGATNWAAPSFSPVTQLLYVTVRESCATFTAKTQDAVPGKNYVGTGQTVDQQQPSSGAVRAIDPFTGSVVWSHTLNSGTYSAGILATGGGVVFAGTPEGFLLGLDGRDGKEIWRFQTGAAIRSAPISYEAGGKQFIALASNSALFVFRVY